MQEAGWEPLRASPRLGCTPVPEHALESVTPTARPVSLSLAQLCGGHPQAQASTPSPKHPPRLLHWPEWHWLFRDVSERLGISWGLRKPSGRQGTLGSGQDSGGLLAVEPTGVECWARRVEEEKSHTPRAHSSPAAGTPTTSAISYVPCRAPGRGRPLSEARTAHPRGAVRWSTYGRPCLRMARRGPGTSLPPAPRQGLCSCQQRPPDSSPGRH